MSFEELAKRTAGHPDVSAAAAARAAEIARKPWHDAFLSDVYPHWQGPMVAASRKAGIESVTHGVAPGLPAAAAQLRSIAPRDWLVSETIVIEASVGVAGWISYSFAGDENDGALVRLAGTRDRDAVVLPTYTKQWAGPRARVIQEAIDDVAAAASLFGPLLVQALDDKEDRLAAEAAAAREAEEARIQAQAQAEADEIARRHQMEIAAHPDEQPGEVEDPT